MQGTKKLASAFRQLNHLVYIIGSILISILIIISLLPWVLHLCRTDMCTDSWQFDSSLYSHKNFWLYLMCIISRTPRALTCQIPEQTLEQGQQLFNSSTKNHRCCRKWSTCQLVVGSWLPVSVKYQCPSSVPLLRPTSTSAPRRTCLLSSIS